MFTPEELVILEEAVRGYCAKNCFREQEGMLNPLDGLLPDKEEEYSQICNILQKLDGLKADAWGMITVIGKLEACKKYIGKCGYNVLPESEGWTPEINLEWIQEAVQRGDDFLILSTKSVSGFFEKEVNFLLRIITTK